MSSIARGGIQMTHVIDRETPSTPCSIRSSASIWRPSCARRRRRATGRPPAVRRAATCYHRDWTMAPTHVRAKVGRPGGRQRPIIVRFLVDTGAVYTVLPERVWRSLKLKPRRSAEFTLADGTTITRGVSECRFTVQGQSATSPVVLGGPEDPPCWVP